METVLLHKSAFLYVTSIFRLSSFVFANALLTGITKTFVPFYSSFPEIFYIFAKYRTPLCLLVSSNLDVSVAIDDCTRLSNIISELRQYAHVLVEDRMTIVSVVDNMQWEYAGFEAKIMEALKDIPLRMISYGSSNNDVAFVIKNTNKKRALQALNDKLFQPEYAERN